MVLEKEINKINKAITDLIYPKVALQKAYNYYHSRRDADQFKHIEENYGIGVPTGISFNPLVRPHIDRVVGEYLGLNQDLKISCKDNDTISNIMREKHVKISEGLYNYLKKHLENKIVSTILENKESNNDPFIEEQLKKIRNNINDSFISEYEIAAQNILDYLKQSRSIDLSNKMQSLLIDLCVTGTCYFRIRESLGGGNVQLEVLNPVNTFVEKNPNSNYLCDSYRVVVRRYMSTEDVISEYREHLTSKQIEELKGDNNSQKESDGGYYYVQGTSKEVAGPWNASHSGILGGLEIHPTWPGETSKTQRYIYPKLWVVHDVEWIEIDYETGVQTKHEGTKIGAEIYIAKGESENVIRTKDDPNKVRLSVNGLFFLDKNGEPNSMIVKTMHLQDKYDLLSFYRDNLIASSGTVGDWIDIAYVPQVLGVDLPERLQKWLAYKKQGAALIDSTQEGAQMMNTIFNGFDDTVKAQSIQAISLAMQTIQQQVSSVTGILPEALAQYEQRDAVSNVQLGVRTTMLLTKQLFNAMDTIYKEVNYDLINIAKIIWPKGITGTIVLGNYSKIFEALPEHYTITDFDIHIEDSSQSYQHIQSLISFSGELIKGGAADLEDITNIMTATSMTQLKRTIDKSIAKKKSENDMVNQLQQQLQQYDENTKSLNKNNQELERKIQQLQNEIENNNKAKLELEAEKLELDKQRLLNDKEYQNKTIDVKRSQIDLQQAETVDSNPYNDKIKSVI